MIKSLPAVAITAFVLILSACGFSQDYAPQNVISINAPFSFTGRSGVFYDTLKGKKGDRYKFAVSFPASQVVGLPGLSFDGSGYGSECASIQKGRTENLFYEPATEGVHPIVVFWQTDACGYFPKEKIIIYLNVEFINNTIQH